MIMLRDIRDTSCLLFLFIGTSLWIGNVFSQQVVDHNPNVSSSAAPEDLILVTSDSCDWTGSGLDASGGRVVVPIYLLRCLQGSIRWRYPDSGLRLLLSNPDREFRGCIRVRRSSSHLNTPNVRVAVEEERGQSLRSLYFPADGQDPDLLRCFSSRHKEAVLFIEAIPSHHSQLSGTASIAAHQKESVFELDYHLEPVESEKVLHNDMAECRPCTDDELVQSFCASDFLVKGSIRSLVENELLSRSEIVVDIESIVRDSGSPSLAEGRSRQPDSIVLHRPLKCHSKAGIGSVTEFLFMGRWVLGNPVIGCAPKYSSWKHVRHRALQSGSSACRL